MLSDQFRGQLSDLFFSDLFRRLCTIYEAIKKLLNHKLKLSIKRPIMLKPIFRVSC